MNTPMKYRNVISGKAGITLVEMLVSLAASSTMLMALALVISTQSRNYSSETNRIQLITNIELASERVSKVLRLAGFRSGALTDMHVNAITSAGASSLTVNYDKNSDGTTEPYTIRLDQSSDASYDAQHPRLLIVDGTGVIFPVGEDITSLSFTYFDSSGAQLSDTSLAASQSTRDTIRRVKVTVAARTPAPDRRTGSYLTSAFAFSVKPRNFLVN